MSTRDQARATTKEWAIGLIVGLWLGLVRWTSRISREGEDELRAALAQGPVILVAWHSRVLLTLRLWPGGRRSLMPLYVTNRDGRIAAAIERRLGHAPVGMARRGSSAAASRLVLRQIRQGQSVGLTADGPVGPARQVQDAPLEWARITDLPVFLVATSTQAQFRLPGWDKLLIPLPFSRASLVYHRWPETIDRRATPEQIDQHRDSLRVALDAVLVRADALVGRAPGP